jgi:hypothetical protein
MEFIFDETLIQKFYHRSLAYKMVKLSFYKTRISITEWHGNAGGIQINFLKKQKNHTEYYSYAAKKLFKNDNQAIKTFFINRSLLELLLEGAPYRESIWKIEDKTLTISFNKNFNVKLNIVNKDPSADFFLELSKKNIKKHLNNIIKNKKIYDKVYREDYSLELFDYNKNWSNYKQAWSGVSRNILNHLEWDELYPYKNNLDWSSNALKDLKQKIQNQGNFIENLKS